MSRNYSNVAEQTTLSSGINASATTLSVGSVTGYPAGPATLIIDPGLASEELVEYANISGTSFTGCTRGVDGTPATSHSTGAVVVHGTSARDFREPNDHTSGTTSVHGITNTASLVTLTGTQTLTNKTLTAPTITSLAAAAPALSGGGSWSGSPTISSPTITTPAITNPTITSGGSWAGSPTLTTPTIADLTNMQHNHSSASTGGSIASSGLPRFAMTSDSSTTASSVRVYWDATPIYNVGTMWSSSNKDRIVAPVSGLYAFSVCCKIAGTGSPPTERGYYIEAQLVTSGGSSSGQPYYQQPYENSQFGPNRAALSGMFYMTANQYFVINANQAWSGSPDTTGLHIHAKCLEAF